VAEEAKAPESGQWKLLKMVYVAVKTLQKLALPAKTGNGHLVVSPIEMLDELNRLAFRTPDHKTVRED
jgi:hypothetical protein